MASVTAAVPNAAQAQIVARSSTLNAGGKHPYRLGPLMPRNCGPQSSHAQPSYPVANFAMASLTR